MKTLITLTLLVGMTVAQSQKTSPSEPIPVHFDNVAIDLMSSLNGGQKYRLKRWLGGPVKKLRQADAKIRDLNKKISRERNKAKKQNLIDTRTKLRVNREAIRRDGRAQFDKFGLTHAQIDRLNSVPRGELRRERYNHRVMLEAPGLSPEQIERIQACIAATDSAQIAMDIQRKEMKRRLADQDKKLQQRVSGDLYNRIRAIEKRYWVAMYYLLTPDQMRATREIRSPRYQRASDRRSHLAMLPGVTHSQSGRVLSLLNEITSETAADDAVIRTIHRKLKQKDLPAAENKQLRAQLSETYKRRGKIHSENAASIKALMTEEQVKAWDAIPPQLSGGDVGRGVMGNLAGMRLRPGQDVTMREMSASTQRAIKAAQKKLRDDTKALRESGMGADSPQMMTMTSMQRTQQGGRARLLRELGHRYCVEVFTPTQLATWIATGKVKP